MNAGAVKFSIAVGGWLVLVLELAVGPQLLC
jgi:hypothetical protein